MRILGLTIGDTPWRREAIPDLPTRQVQEAAIRKWAVGSGHEILRFHDYDGSSGIVEEAYYAGTIQGAAIVTQRALGTYLHVWPPWLRSESSSDWKGQRGWGRPTLIAVDTGQPVNVEELQLEAVRQHAVAYIRDAIPADQSRRMQQARLAKHVSGGYAYGAPPFGWLAYQGWLVPEPFEQQTRNRALLLREEGRTLRHVCELLNAEGLFTRSGAAWTSGSLSRILDRPPPPAESIHPSAKSDTSLYEKAVAAKTRRRTGARAQR
ncbi:hypothetical protein [Streptomyces globosus]|uniref:hypothetical protein n=1 Tax=Streptomyces globosus TaxID=68209 RepID=UPI0031D3BFDF